MPDETFTHDALEFVSRATPSSVEVSDQDAKYAAIFAEVIWDGLITAEKRRQLRTAAELLGLSEERARPIEQALLGAHTARHRIAVVEQQIDEEERHETPDARRSRKSIAPLMGHVAAASRDSYDELRSLEFETRIDSLESDHARLVTDAERLAQENDRLSRLVDELRAKLADSAADAAQASARAAELSSASRPRASRPRIDAPATTGGRHRSRRSIAAPPSGTTPPASSDTLPTAEPPLLPIFAPLVSRAAAPRNDPAELHRLLKRSPRDADILRALFRAFQRADDLDRRFCIAHALVYLGEANDQERATYTTYAVASLVRPSRAIDEDEWTEFVRHPEQDRTIGDALGAIAPAVLLGHVTALRASLHGDAIEPSLEVDPRSSTEPAVRSLAWASAILGVRLPTVCVCRELDRSADIVLTPKPASRIGARALKGRTPRELAFLSGRHLAWYRKELLLAQPELSARRLEDWVVAALLLGHAEMPLTPELKSRVEPLVGTIRPLLNDTALARLGEIFSRFVEQGGRMNLARWIASAEITAASAGLLLANDLGAAESVLRLDGVGDVERMMGELVLFLTSERCSTLRRRIGIAVDRGVLRRIES